MWCYAPSIGHLPLSMALAYLAFAPLQIIPLVSFAFYRMVFFCLLQDGFYKELRNVEEARSRSQASGSKSPMLIIYLPLAEGRSAEFCVTWSFSMCFFFAQLFRLWTPDAIADQNMAGTIPIIRSKCVCHRSVCSVGLAQLGQTQNPTELHLQGMLERSWLIPPELQDTTPSPLRKWSLQRSRQSEFSCRCRNPPSEWLRRILRT